MELITRQLRSADSSATMAYYSSLVYVVGTLIMVPLTLAVGEIHTHPSIAFLFRAWQMPTLIDWAIMSGLGLRPRECYNLPVAWLQRHTPLTSSGLGFDPYVRKVSQKCATS